MEFVTKHKHVLEIQAITGDIYQEAARNVGAKKSPDGAVADDVEFTAELVRLAILSWKTDTGEEPLRGLKPGDARKVIKRTAGLAPYVLAKGSEVTEAEAAGFEVEKGN